MKTFFKLLSLLAIIALTNSASRAQSFTNLAGIWNGVAMDVPAQLLPEFSGPLVTNVSGHDAFGANAFLVNAYSNGTFTNSEATGTMSIDGQGKLTVYPTGASPISFRVNFAQDVFAGISVNNDNGVPQNELNLIVRSPAAFTTNDMTGTWQLITLDTPEQLNQIFLPTTNASAVSDLIGLDNQSVTNSMFSQVGNGYMTFNSDGTLSGNAGDPFTGNFALATNGEVDISFTGSGQSPLAAYINVSKDTMITLNKDDPNNRQEVVMFVKPPTNATLTDLQGPWKITSFGVPEQILLTHNASNYVTGVNSSPGFGAEQRAITAGFDGFVTGMLNGGANIGGFTVTLNGVITANFTNLAGQTFTYSGQLNAGKNCISLVDYDSGQANLTVLTKAPDFPAAVGQDFGLIFFGNAICWATGTNRLLQTAGSLGGAWTSLPATLGQHQFLTSFTNPAGFFQVSQP
jgi:hypothetical protein